MSKKLRFHLVATLAALAVAAGPARAGIVVYEEGDKKLEIGGRIQLQFNQTDPADGETTDDVLFRRLRPYIAGTVSKDWWGKIQFEFGKAIDGDEVAVKDAFMQYRGWENLTLTIGNSKTPFSREFLASSKRQQTVERGFVGDHNFGTPDRQLGFKLEGQNESKKVTWAVALGAEQHDPDAGKVDFDTPANDKDDWNEGRVLAARVDFHPRGFVRFDQGDFHTSAYKLNFSLAAFTWSNDDDNNTYTDPSTGLSTSGSKADLDSSEGIEISAGIRGKGVSVDAEYQVVSADTVDATFTGGVYLDGSTELDKLHLEGGYVFPGNRFELVGKWQSLDADNYQTSWDVNEVGVNYFWNKHKVKAQLTLRMEENVNGARQVDRDVVYLQWQFVF